MSIPTPTQATGSKGNKQSLTCYMAAKSQRHRNGVWRKTQGKTKSSWMRRNLTKVREAENNGKGSLRVSPEP